MNAPAPFAFRCPAAGVAALHLRGLLEAEWLERFLFQTLEPISAEEINATVARAVAAFMAAYGLANV